MMTCHAGKGAVAKLWVVLSLGMVAPAWALEDPTRPADFRAAGQAPAAQRSFSLDSIVLGKDRGVAVIDGEPRTEGQGFEGVRLLRIYPDRVELLDQGRVRVLRLETLPQVRNSQ